MRAASTRPCSAARCAHSDARAGMRTRKNSLLAALLLLHAFQRLCQALARAPHVLEAHAYYALVLHRVVQQARLRGVPFALLALCFSQLLFPRGMSASARGLWRAQAPAAK